MFEPAQFTWGPKSQVPLTLASPNMVARSQLLSLKTSLKYSILSLTLNFHCVMQKQIHGTCVESWV